MASGEPDAQSHPHGGSHIAPYVVLTMAGLFCAWWLWVGLMLARLWHYGGNLNGHFENFDIEPEYRRERLARKREELERAGVPVPVLDAHQWNSNMLDYDEEELEQLPPATRRMILEEQRISRMPAFVADDCGDEDLFPDVSPAIPVHEYNAKLFSQDLATQGRASKEYRALGLHKLGRREWLAHHVEEKLFLGICEARKRLLKDKYSECIQITPEGEGACVELLEEVADFLVKEKPEWFKKEKRFGEEDIINKLTGERWGLQRPFSHHPLEICARLCMEDFNIVLMSQFSGQHTLVASATCAPSGWYLPRQIGRSATHQLEPPLSWDNFSEILDLMNDDSPPLKRTHLFVQTNEKSRGLFDLLFITKRHDFFPGNLSTLHHKLMLRKERQSFRVLPKCGAVVFTTRTRIRAVRDLDRNELEEAVQEIKGWPADIATLKGRDLWGGILENICAGLPAFRDDRTVYGDESSSEG